MYYQLPNQKHNVMSYFKVRSQEDIGFLAEPSN